MVVQLVWFAIHETQYRLSNGAVRSKQAEIAVRMFCQSGLDMLTVVVRLNNINKSPPTDRKL